MQIIPNAGYSEHDITTRLHLLFKIILYKLATWITLNHHTHSSISTSLTHIMTRPPYAQQNLLRSFTILHTRDVRVPLRFLLEGSPSDPMASRRTSNSFFPSDPPVPPYERPAFSQSGGGWNSNLMTLRSGGVTSEERRHSWSWSKDGSSGW